jgi:threonine aldolase
MRFLSVQLEAYLADDHWLVNAQRANGLAQKLANGLRGAKGVSIAHPVEANAVFTRMPEAMAKKLRAAGAVFYDWGVSDDGSVLARLMLSFATPDEDVTRLLALMNG